MDALRWLRHDYGGRTSDRMGWGWQHPFPAQRSHHGHRDTCGLATLYAHLPMDLARLASIVRGLMIHRWEGDRFRYDIPRDRLHNDAETRYADDILAISVGRNDEPLARRREPDDRFVGVCRDFALLYCSFLR